MARKRPGLTRMLGTTPIVSVAYSEIGASVYFALGIVALYAAGLTPWVLLGVGLVILLVTFSYAEASSALPETGGAALFVLIALLTYHHADPGWSHTGSGGEIIHNSGGVVGAWLADVLLAICGPVAYLFPFMIGYLGWLFYLGRHQQSMDYPAAAVRVA